MCTLSWVPRPGGYDLFFNRDELRSRARGHPPRVIPGDPDVIAPADPDGGGTWIVVNTHGVTVCVLNRFDVSVEADRDWMSRGMLVRSLSDLPAATALAPRLESLPLSRYRPFVLAAADPRGVLRVRSDGDACTVHHHRTPGLVATSSGFDPVLVERHRRETFATRFDGDPASLWAIHRSHVPDRDHRSVCMHRADAGTVSLSHVSVTPAEIVFDYVDGPPCVGTPVPPVRRARPVRSPVG